MVENPLQQSVFGTVKSYCRFWAIIVLAGRYQSHELLPSSKMTCSQPGRTEACYHVELEDMGSLWPEHEQDGVSDHAVKKKSARSYILNHVQPCSGCELIKGGDSYEG